MEAKEEERGRKQKQLRGGRRLGVDVITRVQNLPPSLRRFTSIEGFEIDRTEFRERLAQDPDSLIPSRLSFFSPSPLPLPFISSFRIHSGSQSHSIPLPLPSHGTELQPRIQFSLQNFLLLRPSRPPATRLLPFLSLSFSNPKTSVEKSTIFIQIKDQSQKPNEKENGIISNLPQAVVFQREGECTWLQTKNVKGKGKGKSERERERAREREYILGWVGDG